MDLAVQTRASGSAWLVSLVVGLDRRETSDLFLAGDKLISWPLEGLLADAASGPLPRTSMFLSEIVAKGEGLTLHYETEALAARAGHVLAYQVRSSVPTA